MSAVIATRKIGSAVVHAAVDQAQATACGRKITADGTWAAVSAEAVSQISGKLETELRLCAQCDRKRMRSPGEQHNGAPVFDVIREERDAFAVGEVVGIVRGLLDVNGPQVHMHGTVVGLSAPWGETEYLVAAEDGTELLYRGYLLRPAPVVRWNPNPRTAEEINAQADAFYARTAADMVPVGGSWSGTSEPITGEEQARRERQEARAQQEAREYADYTRRRAEEDALEASILAEAQREAQRIAPRVTPEEAARNRDAHTAAVRAGYVDSTGAPTEAGRAAGIESWRDERPWADAHPAQVAALWAAGGRVAPRSVTVRADELQLGDVAPIGGMVGTVVTVTGSVSKGRTYVTIRTEAGAHADESLPNDRPVIIERPTDTELSGPVPIAVRATAAILGVSEEEARAHLGSVHRSAVADPMALESIADEYEALVEAAPDVSPITAEAWRAFGEETIAQGRILQALGIRWRIVDVDPYADASELFRDLRTTGTIAVLSSRLTGSHPVLRDSVNDTFRAVHDILGHAATGRGFDRHGEEAAYQAHARLYSPLARQALATETRGQNAAMIRGAGTFAPQVIGVMPAWAREIGALAPNTVTDSRAAVADAAARHAAQGLGEWIGA